MHARFRCMTGLTTLRVLGLTGLVGLFGLAGCRTVSTQGVAQWREAVVSTREQSLAAFDAVNAVVREDQLAMVLSGQRQTLAEADFSPGLDTESLGRWEAGLGALVTYADAVTRLIGPDVTKSVGDSLGSAAVQLGTTAKIAELRQDRPLASAIGGLGERLAQASATSDARQIMLDADADIGALVERMREMVLVERADADEDGVQVVRRAGVLPTVETSWDTRLAVIEASFQKAGSDAGTRGGIARSYIDVIERKRRSVDTLRRLRESLGELAVMHNAVAQGQEADFGATLATIRLHILAARAIVNDLKAHSQPTEQK